ncbi:MAG: hypothetical protein H7Y01_13950 [Ferruginibacter sp.]|nr:hypothetical protein [Chitinophagaceae bacterium]
MMNVQINQLVKTLLQKDTLEQCSLQELEQYASRHPYFGAAQLLLTKKLQSEKSERYDEQLQKTFLFFHNPLWVEHLLNETGNAEIIAPEKKTGAIPEPVVAGEAEIPAGIPSENINPDVVHAITEINSEPEIETKTDQQEQEVEPVITAPIEIPVFATFENKEDEGADTSPGPDTESTMEAAGDATGDEPALQLPALKIEAIDPEKAELLFEPYHTVDYFASQGVKFKEEEKPRDKFSQQLKSFTDWLKTMKRLPVAEIAGIETKSDLPPGAEQKVEQLAEHSLAEREVVTEAMAEVWEKQGNMVKATEIYNKLSLLYPSKRLYFAAKIEELKKIN